MTVHQTWQQISTQIERVAHHPFSNTTVYPVSGGCINSTYIIRSNNKSYFVKLNRCDLLAMFEAEFSGLEALAQTGTIKVPHPIVVGASDSHSFIVMEKLTFSSVQNQSMEKMGQQLAQLHKIKQNFFGWHDNNTIGLTKQINEASKNWIRFWGKNRLGIQLSLANKQGHGGKLTDSGYKLMELLTHFFNNYSPHPALLHGDLWRGNAAVTDTGKPVIYDPACYFGDRETDIAMTELFGGFSPTFYDAYNEIFPLHSDYPIRKTLYNLYHILNHLNLFGESYRQQAENMINLLLSEIA